MIYIITTESFPNGLAATQRIKCYARSVVDMGFSCEVLCLNRCESLENPIGNTESNGYLEGYSYRYIGGSPFFSQYKLLRWYHKISDIMRSMYFLLSQCRREDKVILYTYSMLLMNIVHKLAVIKGFETFYELNEHPSIQFRRIIKGDCNKDDFNRLSTILNRFNGVMCISTELKKMLIKCGVDNDKIHIVNMIVDPSRFAGIKKQETDDYIGYCGAADNNKDGVDQLIKAFAKIIYKFPNLKLYIMGPKREDCKNEDLARILGIRERVIFTGMINPDKMPTMLVNARVLALARPQSIQAQYGFPTKLGEYLLTGNPVVVTKVGDIPIFLKNGESAYLVDPDSVDDFAAQLEVALSDRNASVVGANGQKVALESFSGETVKSQLKVALSI